ncbi:MAG: NUDIX domain-containing protein, partial [bacterium]
MGIVEKDGKILIEKRLKRDKLVKNLLWAFPGGKIGSLDFEKEIKREIKEETNLDVDVKDIIHARLIPDSPEKKTKILALYFHCITDSNDNKPGKEVSELKWVKPTEVSKYFTTSVCKEVMRF